MKRFPIFRQLDIMDCGPTCLKMVAQFYGKTFSIQKLRSKTFITKDGVNLEGINEAAVNIGFRTLAAKLTFEQLDDEANLPCILYWNRAHFVVLPPQNFSRHKKGNKILLADPAYGLIKVSKETFLKSWMPDGKTGIALLLEPTPFFYESEEDKISNKKLPLFFGYLRPFRKYLIHLFLGMLFSSILSLIFPFLTQSLVDYGINNQDLQFVYIVLFSQIALFIGGIVIDLIRNWLLLHMSTRINVSIISDFLIKLMNLPIRFFDSKQVGDISQRINDHNRIEQFLSNSTLNTLFSLVNIIVFSIVLSIYSIPVLLVFLTGSLLTVLWIQIFMRKRRELDYAMFQQMSDNQNSVFEIVSGMQEIKINSGESFQRWSWERIQAKIFKINIKGLKLGQSQSLGVSFFNQFKNILISFISAKEVLEGNITLGMMLSISYIVGQMNSPISQLLTFLKSFQDAKISIERLNEIREQKNEEEENYISPQSILSKSKNEGYMQLNNLSFRYGAPTQPLAVKNATLKIPFGKVTAIVGTSGSGKTTLMKLLLRFYEPSEGEILINNIPLGIISPRGWRSKCGVVMADGFLFSNSIANNICLNGEYDLVKLNTASKIANVESFINSLPLKYDTKIGVNGNSVSSGQKQRILIARAVYQEPEFLFLDEATSTLDAQNEKEIKENLDNFIIGRTVLVIAHRLSTVKHADQIVVMKEGEIVEIGTHNDLVKQNGVYYTLVKNQLELGN